MRKVLMKLASAAGEIVGLLIFWLSVALIASVMYVILYFGELLRNVLEER